MSNFVTDFFKKDNSINENNHNGNIEEMLQPEKGIVEDVNSHQLGFMDASKSLGNLTGFDLGIDKLYVDYLNKTENIAEKNEKEILEYENFIKSSEQKINNLIEVKTRINEVEIPEEKKLIKSYKSEKEEARITAKIREPRAGLWVDVVFTGLIILLGLAFIWVFYSSVVYNAFFLEINPEVEGSYTLRSIFNPKAFEQAVAMGDFTLILIITAAPMFLLFGLYPHTYSENKRNGKFKKLFYGVAFIVDAVLAYEITHKLYEAQRAFSPDKLPPFSVSIAIMEPNFWIIILLGFVGYLFWTLMFDNWKKNLNRLFGFDSGVMKYNVLIESTEQKIIELMHKSQSLQAEIDDINKNVADRTREFNIPKFNTYDILGKLLGYAKGWLTFFKNSQAPEENVKKLSEKFDVFLRLKNLNNRGILLND